MACLVLPAVFNVSGVIVWTGFFKKPYPLLIGIFCFDFYVLLPNLPRELFSISSINTISFICEDIPCMNLYVSFSAGEIFLRYSIYYALFCCY